MRNISVAGLAKLQTKLGNEPVCIIEIDWVAGGTQSYADQAVGSVPGKIVELGDLDSAVNISGHSGSSSLSVTLDDTDGSIKTLFDTQDPHMVPARVYQYFTGLDLSDRFLLFSGVVTSPISWNERERTVKLTILSQLEDREIGFSADEGEFEFLPASMCNKPWPIVFGTVINNPALLVQPAITGTTLTPIGILAGEDLMMSLPSTTDVNFDVQIAKACYNLSAYADLVSTFTHWLSQAQSAVSDLSGPSPQNLDEWSVQTTTISLKNDDGSTTQLTTYTREDVINKDGTPATLATGSVSTNSNTASNFQPCGKLVELYMAAATSFQNALTKYQGDYSNLYTGIIAKIREFADKEAACQLRRQKKIDTVNANGLGDNPIQILGGEDFPQGRTITLMIEGGLFTGSFNGTAFTVTDRTSDELTAQANGAYNAKLLDQDVVNPNSFEWVWILEQINNAFYSPFGTNVSSAIDQVVLQILKKANAGSWPKATQQSEVNVWYFPMSGDKNVPTMIPTTADGTQWTTYSKEVIEIVTPTATAVASRDPVIQQFWIEPGAEATFYTGDQKTYIASITPGSVLAVRAFKEVQSGVVRLVDVPASLYTVQTTTYGTVTATEVVLNQQLSHILSEGWRDDIYVTYSSTIGPNLADIIQYIIQQYTILACDATSFAHVRQRMSKFPCNFPINDKRNVLQVLQEIAYQARLALWIDNGTVYLKYLAEVPTVNDTITESDIDAEQGVEVELTGTEELVTKMTVNWHLRFATPPSPLKTFQWQQVGIGQPTSPVSSLSYDPGNVKDNNYSIVLRHNITKYLIHEGSSDYYIFNQPDIVYKMATFWLIRKANTWKRIKFTTPLHKLNLETFDSVLLNFSHPYVAAAPVQAIVESARYDSANNCIHFQCLTPVMAGTSVAYPWFWPADLPQSETWPPPGEDCGSSGPGSGAHGPLPVGDTSTVDQVVFVGGTNVVFGTHCDYGDPMPSDTGFVAQTVVTDTDYVTTQTQQAVNDLSVDFAEHTQPLSWTTQAYWHPQSAVVQDNSIDIHSTIFRDGSNTATLSSIIKGIDSNNLMMIDAGAMVSDGTNESAFDFKYDPAGQKFGAGTAFLQDTPTTP